MRGAPDALFDEALAARIGLIRLVEQPAARSSVAGEAVERVERGALRSGVQVARDDDGLTVADPILQEAVEALDLTSAAPPPPPRRRCLAHGDA